MKTTPVTILKQAADRVLAHRIPHTAIEGMVVLPIPTAQGTLIADAYTAKDIFAPLHTLDLAHKTYWLSPVAAFGYAVFAELLLHAEEPELQPTAQTYLPEVQQDFERSFVPTRLIVASTYFPEKLFTLLHIALHGVNSQTALFWPGYYSHLQAASWYFAHVHGKSEVNTEEYRKLLYGLIDDYTGTQVHPLVVDTTLITVLEANREAAQRYAALDGMGVCIDQFAGCDWGNTRMYPKEANIWNPRQATAEAFWKAIAEMGEAHKHGH